MYFHIFKSWIVKLCILIMNSSILSIHILVQLCLSSTSNFFSTLLLKTTILPTFFPSWSNYTNHNNHYDDWSNNCTWNPSQILLILSFIIIIVVAWVLLCVSRWCIVLRALSIIVTAVILAGINFAFRVTHFQTFYIFYTLAYKYESTNIYNFRLDGLNLNALFQTTLSLKRCLSKSIPKLSYFL